MTKEILQIILVIIVSVIASIGLFVLRMKLKKERALTFSDRTNLSDDEFVEHYYRGSTIPKELILDILKAVSSATETPCGRLRPTDRFDKELAPVKGLEFGDGLIELQWRVMKEMVGVVEHEEVPHLNTIDELIRYIYLLRQARDKGKS